MQVLGVASIARRLFTESSIYALGPTLSSSVGFLLLPIYTNYLSPGEYGNLEFVLAIAAFVSPILDGGLTTSFWKFGVGSSDYNKGQVLFNCLIAQLFSSGVLVAVTLSLSYLNPSSVPTRLFAFYSLVLATRTLLQLVFLDIQSKHQATLYVKLSIITSLMTALANIALVGWYRLGVEGVILGNLFGNCASCVLFFPYYVRSFEPRLSIPLLKDLYRYGLPLSLGNVSYLILLVSDRIFLARYSSAYDLGLYGYAYKFASLLNLLIITPFFMGFNPLRWELYARKDAKRVFSFLYVVILTVMVAFYFLFTSASMVLGTFMTRNVEFVGGLGVVPWICFSYLLYGLYYFRSMGLLFEKKTNLIALVIGCSALANLALNFMLIPSYSFWGAGIATALSYLLIFIICGNLSQKYYSIKVDNFLESFALVLVGSLCIFAWFFRETLIPWHLGLLALLSCVLFLGIVGIRYWIVLSCRIPSCLRRLS